MRRTATVGALALAALVVAARPASAHGVGGVGPTDYETRIVDVDPRVDGLDLRPVDLGERLELHNTTGTEVLVLGYFGEPYLRVGPDGAFENRASPSWAANREPDRIVDAPDPDALDHPPDWVRIGSGDTLRWHDHRAHWMGSEPPATVRTDPGSEHVVEEFEIVLEHGLRTVTVLGEIAWVPGPSPWPWMTAAAALGLGVIALTRIRRWPAVLAFTLAVAVAAEAVHVAGGRAATTAGLAGELAGSAYSLAALVVGIGALGWLVLARDPYDATPLVLVAGLFFAIAGGFADVSVLARSQLPTTLPHDVERFLVVVAMGLGSGVTAGAALRLRRPMDV